jgi:hypothetical protein
MSRDFLITHAWLLAVIFILLLTAVVFVRHKLGSGVEIKATDAGARSQQIGERSFVA